MDEAPDLLRRIDQLGIGFWTGTAYRHTSPARNPLSGEGASQFGGRWNSPGISTLYLAFPRETCVQEFIRMATKQPGGVESFQDRALHEIEVRDTRVLDLRTEAALASRWSQGLRHPLSRLVAVSGGGRCRVLSEASRRPDRLGNGLRQRPGTVREADRPWATDSRRYLGTQARSERVVVALLV